MLYGKWRPQGFDEVVGQEHVVTTLRNALASGQVAHAYLFSGPRGTGKTTTARILARAINCVNLKDGDPCNECQTCTAIRQGAALDLIEMDAASNRGIDDIRQLREKIAFAPSDLGKKVYLLDEVHMLTEGAWNALLKTLEEPPPHAYFILATTELHDVPATVVSRCQRFDFHRVANDAITGRLGFICEQEGFQVDDASLTIIAKQSKGGLRDAITLLEQVTARFGDHPTEGDVLAALGLLQDHRSVQLADAIIAKDLAAALDVIGDVADSGVHLGQFTRETMDHLREEMSTKAREGHDVRALVHAITELSRADFRLDPANPVPLEIACATVILGVAQAPTVAAAPAEGRGAGAAPQARRTQRPQGGGKAAPVESSADQDFLRDLYNRCSMISITQAAFINGSCEVLSMDEEILRLGFYFPMHMQKVDRDCRPLIEEQAAELLGRKVRLEVELLERKSQNRKSAARSGGHLADAARAIGATPVGKDAD